MEGILDLLDLDDELADIQDVLQQFDTQDKRAEQRTRSETAELRAMEQKAKELEVGTRGEIRCAETRENPLAATREGRP